MNREAQQLALDFVSRSERSVFEVRTYLSTKGVPAPEAEEVIEYLVAKRYVDESRLAQRLVESAPPDAGRLKTLRKLEKRGVGAESLAEASSHDEKQKALTFLRGRPWKNLAQSARALVARGFEEEVVASACEEYWEVES